MALTARISLTGPPAEEPEDFLAETLGVVFPDDIMNQHGDHEHDLLYTSPHLPHPLAISLADPKGEEDRRLFGHYLWNSSLQLAELIEAGTLGIERLDSWVEGRTVTVGEETPPLSPGAEGGRLCPPLGEFDVRGLETIELGAGTALPSLMAALLGAKRVRVTDYPAPATIENLKAVVGRNCVPGNSPFGTVADVSVEGHEWGVLDTPFAMGNKGRFDRVFVCDCLWMPWQHGNLRRSVGWFLKDGPEARAWVIAGFHTGREKMGRFFDEEGLREEGLEVEKIWEMDCNGVEKEWAWDRGREDENVRKRWLAIAILRRVAVEVR